METIEIQKNVLTMAWRGIFFPLFYIPRSVERLVEKPCAFKHKFHIRHIGHVPVVEGLVEGACVFKHTEHIRHIGHVPLVERLVEGGCATKHTSHIRHFGHVPII